VLAEVLEAKGNSFNAVRLLAALAVVVSHSFALVFGSNLAQPISWGAYNLGANAVNVFFVLSGLMLSRSFERDADLRTYTAARVLRIFPALLVAGMVVGWVVGPLAASPSIAGYFGDLQGLLYPLTSLVIFNAAHVHSGFAGSPFPDELNMPLWTVKYELLAYAVFGLASVTGLLRGKFTVIALCVLFGLALTLASTPASMEHSPLTSVIRFGFCFLVGVVLYRFRDVVQLKPGMAILIVAAVVPLGLTFLGPATWILALAYGAVTLASCRLPVVTGFSNRWDISFGVYIYGWPIQQIFMGVEGVHDILVLHVALSLLVVMIVGWLSFVIVERPAMRQRRWLAGLLWPRLRREQQVNAHRT
jgi:peptidoglycan/LPS O-acetylase OafA/YrhL